jgi:V8-like Glu-specific endopeptidase
VAFKKEIRNDLEYADFALIRLDRRVRNRTPLGVNRSGLPVDLRATLTMIGYPAGIPQKIALGGSVKGSVAGQPFFTANLDSLGGNSGSPVINEATGLIEGILGGKVTTRTSPGDMDFVISPKNEDCLIENQKTEAEALGDLVTRISEVTEAIPNLK